MINSYMEIWIPLIVTSVVVTILAFLAIFVFHNIWRSESKFRKFVQNTSLAIFSVLYIFLVLEIIFGVFFVQSDGFGFTLSAKRWDQKYWNPINSGGYRDHEHQEWKKNILFVVGDSFIEGHGIKNIDDRLPDIWAKKLGSEWTVVSLAKCGWSSADEYKALVNHPKRPQKIILSYYINDIDDAAKANGLKLPKLIKKPNKIYAPLIDNSFVFNWFYWRLNRGVSGADKIYWNYLKQAYRDPKIWNSHKKELRDIINFARQSGSEIAFIVWPELSNIDGSVEFTSKVSEFITEQDVKVIDLTTYFRNRKPETLVVNAMDSHPNEKVNKEVAEFAYKLLFLEK